MSSLPLFVLLLVFVGPQPSRSGWPGSSCPDRRTCFPRGCVWALLWVGSSCSPSPPTCPRSRSSPAQPSREASGVAVGNILGGIAIQTVVLVALDAFGTRGDRPLTYQAASLVLVLEAMLVVGVLAVVIAATQLPASLVALRLTPDGPHRGALGGRSPALNGRGGHPGHESGEAPDNQRPPRGHYSVVSAMPATAVGSANGRSTMASTSRRPGNR